MRKLVMFNMITVDGYFVGENDDISWHKVDGEFNEYSEEMMNTYGTLLFGRITYELMASYWPTPEGKKDDPVIAKAMNELPKVVFSHSIDQSDWSNVTFNKGNLVDEVSKMKEGQCLHKKMN